MQELEKLFKKVMFNAEKKEFEAQVTEDAAMTFIRICEHIGLDHQQTFHDGGNKVYQLNITKINSKYEVVQTFVDSKLLKSLIGDKQDVIAKFLSYAKKHKTLKNPKVQYNYGFYYRQSGKLLMHPLANFDKQSASFNRESGEIKVFAGLPEVKKPSSVLALYINAICSNPHAFLQWLSIYTMELRRNFKKPSLCLHGDYTYPALALIEQIYSQGYILSSHKTLPSAIKFDDFENKCFVYTSNALDHRKVSRMFNKFGKQSVNTYLAMNFTKAITKKVQYAESYCFNIYFYPKEVQLENLKMIGCEQYLDFVKDEIGSFCRKYLHQYYKEIMQDEDIMADTNGMHEVKPCDYMTDEQAVSFAKYLTRKIKKTDIDYFKFESSNYIANQIMSEEFVKYHCLLFNIDFDCIIAHLKELEIVADFVAQVETPFGIKRGVPFSWVKFMNK